MGRMAVVVGGWLALLQADAGVAANDWPPEFLVGDYALVGQRPDAGTPYVGTASLASSADGLVLTRRVGTAVVQAVGRFEVPQPPGEGSVLRFRWNEPAPMVMSCLLGSDLDNYARLTCTLIVEGQRHRQPGIEAWFPSAAWQDTASD